MSKRKPLTWEAWRDKTPRNTVFEVIEHNGETATVLEHVLRGRVNWSGLEYADESGPLLVDAATWKRALALDPEAVAAANKAQPGIVYDVPEIVDGIKTRTRLAAYADTEAERDAASRWLKTALATPRHKHKGRPLFAWQYQWCFRAVYRDVLTIRGVHTEGPQELEKLFPELRGMLPELRRAILSAEKPIDAAAEIVAAFVPGEYEAESLRKALEKDSDWATVRPALERKARRRAELRLSGPA